MGNGDSITDELRADILSGDFPPGERLVELRLTDQYDCGRLAVRTALVELASEGLIEREANRGATVRHVSVHEAPRCQVEGRMRWCWCWPSGGSLRGLRRWA